MELPGAAGGVKVQLWQRTHPRWHRRPRQGVAAPPSPWRDGNWAWEGDPMSASANDARFLKETCPGASLLPCHVADTENLGNRQWNRGWLMVWQAEIHAAVLPTLVRRRVGAVPKAGRPWTGVNSVAWLLVLGGA